MTPCLQIRILLVDDHVLFRESLARLLAMEPDFVVVGRTASVTEALDILRVSEIDVILLDYDLGADRATDLIAGAREAEHRAHILIVTAGVGEQDSINLIQSGVAGIFHKHNPPEALCGCIRQVHAGELWLERAYLRPLFHAVDITRAEPAPVLTDKERQVLRSVFQGLGNKEIAERTGTSETSVKNILQQLFRKSGVRTRTQLVRVALEQWRDQL